MIFRQLYDRASSTYSYLLADPTSRDAVLLDPVFEHHHRDLALLRELDLTLRYTLETHCHADHVTGAWLMKQATGSEIGVAAAAGVEGADLHLRHGDEVVFGAQRLEVRATPGHTDGCLTFVTADHTRAFTGDALLIRGAGRTDFQAGSAAALFRSIHEQVFTLPDGCAIHPGHDYSGRISSTVEEERRLNPRLGGQAREQDFVAYMDNLGLPHPSRIDVALPANLRCGRPESGEYPHPASWGPVVVNYAGVCEIDAEWVARHRDAVHILDVRRTAELADELGTLGGALQIPLGELRDRAGELPRGKPIVTLCPAGKRSAMATLILREAGIPDAANITGGLLRWRLLGLPS